MRKPKKIPIEKYDYPLPDDKIAKYPMADRDGSKVLVYRPGSIGQKQVFDDQSPHEHKQSSQEQELLEGKHPPPGPELPEGKHLSRGPELRGQKPVSHVPELIEEKQFSQDHERLDQKPVSHVPELIEEKQFSQDHERLDQKPAHVPKIIEQKHFSQVPELLEKSDRLYFNTTRVVQARLIFRKSTGARIEIFCLEPFLPADHQLAFSSTGPVEFVCLIGNSKKWKEGKLTKNLGERKISGEGKVAEENVTSEYEEDKVTGEMGTSGDGEDRGNGEMGTSGDGEDKVTGEMGTSEDGEDKVTVEMGTSEYGEDKVTGELLLTAEPAGRQDDKFIVRFSWNDPGTSFGEILERSGSTPIPPYLNREAETQDAATYQTVYARQDGSVAAPTAGLHFTDRVLDALDRKGVRRHELILHVGAGTFIPVKEENAVDHRMHAELVTADRSLLESLLSGDRKIAVGTTTTRSLESIYWLGVKAISNTHFSFDNLCLDQWDAYTMEDEVPLDKAVKALLKKMDNAGMESFSFHTRLMITPGYRFRVIGGLFTNFHQPKSTLLLLIAAVAGDDWRKIYDFALENEFRFLSYGDSSLLFVQEVKYDLPGDLNSLLDGIEVEEDLKSRDYKSLRNEMSDKRKA